MPASQPLSNRTQAHIDEGRANYARYELLKQQKQNYGWAVVLLFYSALHLVEAYKTVHHPKESLDGHDARREYVWEELRDIYEHYEAMYQISRNARYKLRKFSVQDVIRFHDDRFAKIRRYFREQGIAWQSSPRVTETDQAPSSK